MRFFHFVVVGFLFLVLFLFVKSVRSVISSLSQSVR